MYEFFRVFYCKVINRLSTFFTRRRLAFCLGRAFAVFGFVQTPLKRFRYSLNGYEYIVPSSASTGNANYLETTGIGRPFGITFDTNGGGVSYHIAPVSNLNTLGFNYSLSTVFSYPLSLTPYPVTSSSPSSSTPYSLYINLVVKSRVPFVSGDTLTIYFYTPTNVIIGSAVVNLPVGSDIRTFQIDTGYQLTSGNWRIVEGETFTNTMIGSIRVEGSCHQYGFQVFDLSFAFLYRYPSSMVSQGYVQATIPGTPATQETVNQFTQADNTLNSDFNEYQDVEGKYTDDFKRAEAAISEAFTGWSWGSLRPAALWVGQQLTNVYNLSGDFRQYIVYPLLLGVALVFLGRWGSVRSSKRAHNERNWARDNNKYHGDYE